VVFGTFERKSSYTPSFALTTFAKMTQIEMILHVSHHQKWPRLERQVYIHGAIQFQEETLPMETQLI